jgi:hypothetical protein
MKKGKKNEHTSLFQYFPDNLLISQATLVSGNILSTPVNLYTD